MDKIIRTYVQKSYRGILFSDVKTEEVTERDPLKIENDGVMQGFRFYDQRFVIDGTTQYTGEMFNYSNWIYFGERLSFEDVLKRYSDNQILINNMKDTYNYVCHTQAGSFLPLDDGDMTYDEYVQKVNEKNKTLGQKTNIKKQN